MTRLMPSRVSIGPFYYRSEGPADASIDAAVVTAAAHRVLVNYFPAQQESALDSQYATSLAGITADPALKSEGVAVGEAAAQAVITARMGDGLEANVTPYTPGSGPGAWIPTPPAFAPPVTPWLGQMRPFTMKAPDDFFPARAAAPLRFQRDVCPGLQSDALLWRNYQ